MYRSARDAGGARPRAEQLNRLDARDHWVTAHIGNISPRWHWRSRMSVLSSESVQEDRRPEARNKWISRRLLRESDFVVCLVVANEKTENFDERGGVRADEEDRLLHQHVARQSRGRGRAHPRARQ
jgi:hypothetical protein